MSKKIRCTQAGCYVVVDTAESGGSTRCEKHRKEQKKRQTERRVRRNSDSVYDRQAWRRLREKAMWRDDGLCQDCFDQGIIQEAHVVDHTIEIEDLKAEGRLKDAFRLDLLRCLCHKCHNSVTKHRAKLRKEKMKENSQYKKSDDDYLVYG